MYIGIILTILTGFFFLIGIVVLKNNKNKEKTEIFTTALAFIVMLGLIAFDLVPELIESNNFYLLIPVLLGMLTLVFLDKLIPHHHHEHTELHCDKEDHELHLNHIGIVTIIALTIHNVIEGLSLYTVTLNSLKSGLLMMLSISLHNIPLGFQLGNSLKNKKYSKLLTLMLCFSSVIGALIIIVFGSLNELVISILLSITLGMLLYILIFELFSEVINAWKKKETIYGIITGVIILIVALIV